MLTFLRRIRRTLIESGSARKYLLYGIGEIALVVIGILVALQINNWNEQKKSSREEQSILINLKKDFEINKETLILQNEDMQEQIDEINFLLSLTPKIIPDSLILFNLFRTYYALQVVTFQPADATLKETISSGKLQTISSGILRSKLTSWTGSLEAAKEHESKIINLKELELRPFMFECCPHGIDYQENYLQALSDYRFRTMLHMYGVMLNAQIKKRVVLQELVTSILMNLDKEIG
jgi:hypothetical protein